MVGQMYAYIHLRYGACRKTTGGDKMAKLIVDWLGRRKGAEVFVKGA
jgi:hypothetical protein